MSLAVRSSQIDYIAIAAWNGAIMHELGIASNIVEIVQKEISIHRYGRVATVALRIGEMTDIDHESLRFGFEVITRNTSLAETRLVIESIPISITCDACGRESNVERYQFRCPSCGSTRVTLCHGTELDIAYLEIDDQAEVTGKQETGTIP